MEIKTKFSVGDKVKVVANPVTKTTCPFCKGKQSMEIDGTTIYCQNCDNGTISVRTSEKVLVDGVITKIMLEVENIDCEDDEWWYGGKEGELGIREDYGVDVNEEKYYGKGTYNSSEVRPSE